MAPASAVKPRCYDCLSEDVAVKVTDTCGFDHWFCAADWAAQQEFSERITKMLEDAAAALADHSDPSVTGLDLLI